MQNETVEVEKSDRRAGTLLFLSFMLALLILSPRVMVQIQGMITSSMIDLRHLITTSPEQRKIETYGDTTIMGYGYLEKILKKMPEPHFFPFMRYPYYDMNAEVVFPGQRYLIDKRMLVGIDLSPQDLSENKIADASPIMKQPAPQSLLTGWVFLTTWDYDQITGLRIHLKAPVPSGKQSFKATLLHSPDNRVAVGSWTWKDVDPANPLTLHFDKPVEEVYSRGSLPFLLFLENSVPLGGRGPEIARMEVLGIKVRTAGYTIVRQDGKCFAALRTSFLSDVEKNGPESWRRYLLNLTNLPAVASRLEISKQTEGRNHV